MAFTQREFLFLDDLLHAEELQVKKLRAYAQQCQDPQLKQMLQSMAQRHEHHFNTLLQQLNRQGTAPPMAAAQPQPMAGTNAPSQWF
ncbi:MAG: hypothetical protein H0Z37_03225 [Firmicutes bacterium]|nr:hypothetical protein [Bacillota bacterium]